jgi:hypothetical protein
MAVVPTCGSLAVSGSSTIPGLDSSDPDGRSGPGEGNPDCQPIFMANRIRVVLSFVIGYAHTAKMRNALAATNGWCATVP